MNVITAFALPSVDDDFNCFFGSPDVALLNRLSQQHVSTHYYYEWPRAGFLLESTTTAEDVIVDVSSCSELLGTLADMHDLKRTRLRIRAHTFHWDRTLTVSDIRRAQPLVLDFSGILEHDCMGLTTPLVDVTDCRNIFISGLVLNQIPHLGLRFSGCENFGVESCIFFHCADTVIHIAASCVRGFVRQNYLSQLSGAGILISGDTHDVMVCDNRIENTFSTSLGAAAIVVTQADSPTQRSLLDSASWVGLRSPFAEYANLKYPHNIGIEDNQIFDCKSVGVLVDGGVDVWLARNEIRRCSLEGIAFIAGCIGCMAVENTVTDSGHEAIASLKGLIGSRRDLAGSPGIHIEESAYSTILLNSVLRNGGGGVMLYASVHACVVGMNTIFTDATNSMPSSCGISIGLHDRDRKSHLSNACTRNTLFSNNIRGDYKSGIYLGKQAITNNVFDNVIFQTTSWSLESEEQVHSNISLNNLSPVKTKNIYVSQSLKMLMPEKINA